MYYQIFSALVSKPMIHVFTDDKEYKEVFAFSKRMILSDDSEKSDIVLITNRSTFSKIMRERQRDVEKGEKPILFVTDYHFLKLSTDVVGAFYWRKGRSQLLFIKNRLDEHNITLPKEYKDFLVDEL